MDFINTNLKFRNKLNHREYTSVIIIHHAKSKYGNIEDIHKWHLNRGWSGCGYHYFIQKDGQVFVGRPDHTVGAHAKNFNDTSIGICLQGDFEKEEITKMQLNRLQELCNYLRNKFDIDEIKMHREVGNTRCPGHNFTDEILKIIQKPFQDYTVKRGDTLWSISRRYNISVNELKKLNNLSSNMIYTNQIIRVL